MEKYFALIKSGLVKSIIVADDDFIQQIQNEYEYIVDVTDSRPNIGDSYYPDTNDFISNMIEVIELPYDPLSDYLQSGTKDSFEPFNLSKYSVKYENGRIHIGCKQYNAPGLLTALHEVLIENKMGTVSCFNITDDYPSHGKFDITWEDVQLLYDNLKDLRV